ncbi:16S rRNA (guanine(966)-N(2))-methyltransferase RsmD [Prauserella marina]|uniref:16S rRNA (Guanine966-N2)-methyltransferase n=1 Tax=Prauserella marina TaxID=530584 RepID=A0A222VLS1_9PSEU|nr:16S rRNA (guanine(966)-N(2))-methyltransferase RsmD [Prauserella marina]ASR34703.1 16S rRNA (guanine(966)-N(2))-methyltransferase RsmD [Prauserella marina]PWV85637.1 16S rRNA (guanine966-N2)-methyltransferase [Prauserella marina]SDC49757.1 16S rRNA (guanine966-N2)-methyltransferase [Prauserella marina]
MTRIVAGKAGGRRLRVPPKGTRPTSERVREALFNALDVAGELDGASVLDLYAGSGALGFEALSRGARKVLFVESDRKAVEVLRANADAIGLGGTVRHGKVDSVVGERAAKAFDLVVADPPYAVDSGSLATVLGALVDNGWLADGALVIVERATREGEPPWPEALRGLRVKRYGDTALFWAEYCVTSRA